MKPRTQFVRDCNAAQRDALYRLDLTMKHLQGAERAGTPVPCTWGEADLNQAERDLHAIIEAAAQVLDKWNGRTGKRGSTLKKVRKVLGYTYP